MKKFILFLLVCFSFSLSANAIEYQKMEFIDAMTGKTVIEECGYNSNGVLRCKGDTVPDDYVPSKYSYGYDYKNNKSYTIIEKGNKTTIYNQGQKVFSYTK